MLTILIVLENVLDFTGDEEYIQLKPNSAAITASVQLVYQVSRPGAVETQPFVCNSSQPYYEITLLYII